MKTLKNSITDLVFVLDRSGSMSGLERDTIGGFNNMLRNQRELTGECFVTTALFDHELILLHNRVKIQKVAPLTEYDYQVRGSTALYDALGLMIQRASALQKDTLYDPIEHRVLFVIITDGEENSSREYTGKAIKSLIEHRKAEFGWEFIFLGANIDAERAAENIGISKDRSANYKADSQGTLYNYEVLDSVIQEYRTSASISDDHLEKIRRKNDDNGNTKR